MSLLPSVLLLVLRTHNNTDGNKLVIFSSISLYYGDTHILMDSTYRGWWLPAGGCVAQSSRALSSLVPRPLSEILNFSERGLVVV